MNKEYLKILDNEYLVLHNDDNINISKANNEDMFKDILKKENILEKEFYLKSLLELDINNCYDTIKKLKTFNSLSIAIAIVQIILISLLIGIQIPVFIGTIVEILLMRSILIPKYSTLKRNKNEKKNLENKLEQLNVNINNLNKELKKLKNNCNYNTITDKKEIDYSIKDNLNTLISEEQLGVKENTNYPNITKFKKLIKKKDITTKV